MSDEDGGVLPRITRDPEVDALHIRFAGEIGAGEVVSSDSFALNARASEVTFDFDAHGQLLGIEILGTEGLFKP